MGAICKTILNIPVEYGGEPQKRGLFLIHQTINLVVQLLHHVRIILELLVKL